jgi:hypothetical protein
MPIDPSLPRITRYMGCDDSGEFGNANCPHCGAEGRYVHRFKCEDGSYRGAMSGCIELFQWSPTALLDRKLTEKARERKLNKNEQRVRFALDEFYAGRMPEAVVTRMAEQMMAANREYARRFH